MLGFSDVLHEGAAALKREPAPGAVDEAPPPPPPAPVDLTDDGEPFVYRCATCSHFYPKDLASPAAGKADFVVDVKKNELFSVTAGGSEETFALTVRVFAAKYHKKVCCAAVRDRMRSSGERFHQRFAAVREPKPTETLRRSRDFRLVAAASNAAELSPQASLRASLDVAGVDDVAKLEGMLDRLKADAAEVEAKLGALRKTEGVSDNADNAEPPPTGGRAPSPEGAAPQVLAPGEGGGDAADAGPPRKAVRGGRRGDPLWKEVFECCLAGGASWGATGDVPRPVARGVWAAAYKAASDRAPGTDATRAATALVEPAERAVAALMRGAGRRHLTPEQYAHFVAHLVAATADDTIGATKFSKSRWGGPAAVPAGKTGGRSATVSGGPLAPGGVASPRSRFVASAEVRRLADGPVKGRF